MPVKTNLFQKSSRLHHRKDIELLFNNGKQIREFPVWATYNIVPWEGSPIKMAVAVPKKKVKAAVNRNRVKRLIREAFRLNCHNANAYFEKQQLSVRIMFVFNGAMPVQYSLIESKIILILQRLVKSHEQAGR